MMKSGELSAGRQTNGEGQNMMGSATSLDQIEGEGFIPDDNRYDRYQGQNQYRSQGSSNYGNPNFVPPQYQ